MARLDSWEGISLEITPVLASVAGPHDAYEVRLWQEDGLIFSHQYNVAGWHVGHSEVLNIARAFQVAHRLADQEVGVNLYAVQDDPPDDLSANKTTSPLYRELCLHLNVIWMDVTLWATTLYKDSPEEQVRITLRLHLWTSPDADYAPDQPPSEPLTRFVVKEFTMLPEEAKMFGAALQAECIHAQQLRRTLNLEHFDDSIDFI